MSGGDFIRAGDGFFVHKDFIVPLRQAGIGSPEAVFSFAGGTSLHKKELAGWRSRTEILLPDGSRCFLKRYAGPPVAVQIKNWLAHHSRRLTALYDFLSAGRLAEAGIHTPKVIAFGGRWKGLFEKESFVLTLGIPQACSLETGLPDCFYAAGSENRRRRTAFIDKLADFARRFHGSGLCHRDFYLCHIFLSGGRDLYLIDLQRAFTPVLFRKRWRLKDIAQLYYSAPGDIISSPDRLRFFLRYLGKERLSSADRFDIKRIKRRAWRMAGRDIRRGRPVPFAQ